MCVCVCELGVWVCVCVCEADGGPQDGCLSSVSPWWLVAVSGPQSLDGSVVWAPRGWDSISIWSLGAASWPG